MTARIADERSRLIERIQQLLALTQSSNEHEAAVAAAKVQELLVRYNLTEEEVIADGPVAIPTVEFRTPGKTSQEWERLLVDSICRMMFCRMVYTMHSNLFQITGRKTNIDVALRTISFLIVELNRLAKNAEDQYVALTITRNWVTSRARAYTELTDSYHPYSYRISWLRGAVAGIYKQMQIARSMEDADEQAIVLVRDEEVDALFKKQHPRLRSHSPERALNSSGYGAGYEAGKTMNLGDKKELK